MRRLLSVSILALSLAMAPTAYADAWFRLNISPTIYFGVGGQDEGPPGGGGVNDSIGITVDAEIDGRVYGSMSVPVTISGIDATYAVSVADLPSGASWTADSQAQGTIIWPSATQGTYRPTIDVRDAEGALVASAEIEIIVHPQLTAAVPQTSYEVEVGDDLSIVPTATGLITPGAVQWGSMLPDLPEWLDLDAATGVIEVDTAATNSFADIVLTAVDQTDHATASTLPFSIVVNGATTNYWMATLGGAGTDIGNGIAVGSDGSIYITGYTDSTGAGSNDLLVAKYTATGDLSWKRTLGGMAADVGYGIAVGSDGSIYVTGYTTNSAGAGNVDLLIAKYTAMGDLSWKKTLVGAVADYGYSIAVGLDGSIYMTGYTSSASAGNVDLLIAKYTAGGDLSWEKTLGGASSDFGYSIAIASDGSIYVTGDTSSAGDGNNDLLVAKYTAAGDLSWKKTLGGTSSDVGYGIAIASDGSIYIAGGTNSAGAGNVDLLIAKYTAAGDLSWEKTLGGALTDVGYGIAVGTDGSIYVTGVTSNAGAGGNDLLVAKYTATGDLSWEKALGGTRSDVGKGIAVGSDGSVYVTGYTNIAGAGNDLLVARLPADDGADMTAGAWTWQEVTLMANPSPNLTHGPNPSLTSNANPSLTHGPNPTLAIGAGADLTSTTTQFGRE